MAFTHSIPTKVAVPAAVALLGRLDVCVANAGKWPPEDQPVWNLSLERWNLVIDRELAAGTDARRLLIGDC